MKALVSRVPELAMEAVELLITAAEVLHQAQRRDSVCLHRVQETDQFVRVSPEHGPGALHSVEVRSASPIVLTPRCHRWVIAGVARHPADASGVIRAAA